MRLILLEETVSKYWDDNDKDLIDNYSSIALLLSGIKNEEESIKVDKLINSAKKGTKFKITLELISDKDKCYKYTGR